MTIQNLLDKYSFTQEQLALFMGVPRGRVAMWLQKNKDTPPKEPDSRFFEIAVNFFTNLPDETAKEAINLYHIVLGNVELRREGGKLYKTAPPENQENIQEPLYGYVAENKGEKYGENTDDSDIDAALSSEDTKSSTGMIQRILAQIEKQNETMSRIALAAEKTASANESLARTIENLSGMMRDTTT